MAKSSSWKAFQNVNPNYKTTFLESEEVKNLGGKVPLEWLSAIFIKDYVNPFASDLRYSEQYYEAVMHLFDLNIAYIPDDIIKDIEVFEDRMEREVDALPVVDRLGNKNDYLIPIIKRNFAKKVFRRIMLTWKRKGKTQPNELQDYIGDSPAGDTEDDAE